MRISRSEPLVSNRLSSCPAAAAAAGPSASAADFPSAPPSPPAASAAGPGALQSLSRNHWQTEVSVATASARLRTALPVSSVWLSASSRVPMCCWVLLKSSRGACPCLWMTLPVKSWGAADACLQHHRGTRAGRTARRAALAPLWDGRGGREASQPGCTAWLPPAPSQPERPSSPVS